MGNTTKPTVWLHPSTVSGIEARRSRKDMATALIKRQHILSLRTDKDLEKLRFKRWGEGNEDLAAIRDLQDHFCNLIRGGHWKPTFDNAVKTWLPLQEEKNTTNASTLARQMEVFAQDIETGVIKEGDKKFSKKRKVRSLSPPPKAQSPSPLQIPTTLRVSKRVQREDGGTATRLKAAVRATVPYTDSELVQELLARLDDEDGDMGKTLETSRVAVYRDRVFLGGDRREVERALHMQKSKVEDSDNNLTTDVMTPDFMKALRTRPDAHPTRRREGSDRFRRRLPGRRRRRLGLDSTPLRR